MIETMNEQQLKLTNFMREHDLSHETDLRFRFPEPDVNLCDNGESFPNLESRLGARLGEVFDPHSTTLRLLLHPHLTPLGTILHLS